MNIQLRGVWNIIEWGVEFLVDRLGIRRRHVVFGLVVLFLSAIITSWYIYDKNWVITGTNKKLCTQHTTQLFSFGWFASDSDIAL